MVRTKLDKYYTDLTSGNPRNETEVCLEKLDRLKRRILMIDGKSLLEHVIHYILLYIIDDTIYHIRHASFLAISKLL